MAAGTIIGGEAASLIKGRSMAGTLGRGGKAIPSNPVLEAARREAGLPPVTDLKTPDRPVGAVKGVPKTKEITKVEGQIKKNVAQQKSAIKAGNFGLVSELKEVYAYLVTQLKEMVVSAKEGIKSQGGFANFSGKGQAPDIRKGKFSETQDNQTLKELMDYDTAPITVKGDSRAFEGKKDSFDVDGDDADFRLLQLQTKAGDKALNKPDLAEARALLIDRGVLAPDAQSNNLGKRNTQYQATNSISNTDITNTVPDNTPNANTTAVDSATPSLLEEAKKFESPSAFRSAAENDLSTAQTTRRAFEQLEVMANATKDKQLNNLKGGTLAAVLRDNPSLKGSIPDTVTIYRAGDGSINEGQFVSLEKGVAQQIVEGRGGQMKEIEVPTTDLQFANSDEFFYVPQAKIGFDWRSEL